MEVVIIVDGQQISMNIRVGNNKWNVFQKMDLLDSVMEIFKLCLFTPVYRKSSEFSIKLKINKTKPKLMKARNLTKLKTKA